VQSDDPAYLLDTNIILRFLLADDPNQSQKARTLMANIAGGQVLAEVKDFIILELTWVLESSCYVPRQEIADKLINILNFSGIVNSNRATLIQALLNYKKTRIDLADCLLAAYSAPDTPVFSFDKDLKRLGAHLGSI